MCEYHYAIRRIIAYCSCRVHNIHNMSWRTRKRIAILLCNECSGIRSRSLHSQGARERDRDTKSSQRNCSCDDVKFLHKTFFFSFLLKKMELTTSVTLPALPLVKLSKVVSLKTLFFLTPSVFYSFLSHHHLMITFFLTPSVFCSFLSHHHLMMI